MNIKGSLQNVINKIVDERTNGKADTAHAVGVKAVQAILKGQRDAAGIITPEWQEFMNFLLIAAQPEGTPPNTPADPIQLARLLPTDGTTDDVRQRERAYIIANGICGTPTTDTMLDGNVTAVLDIP
ncbi:MAG TPA: hypothetical protein VF588_10570 [Pyrinomonadaceae bacterium]|jgi:hypothetical protein